MFAIFRPAAIVDCRLLTLAQIPCKLHDASSDTGATGVDSLLAQVDALAFEDLDKFLLALDAASVTVKELTKWHVD